MNSVLAAIGQLPTAPVQVVTHDIPVSPTPTETMTPTTMPTREPYISPTPTKTSTSIWMDAQTENRSMVGATKTPDYNYYGGG